MKSKFKKVLSLITIIAIVTFVAITPMLHTHACHDTNCLVNNFHSCHDADCVIYLLLNKYQNFTAVILSCFVFLSWFNLKSAFLELNKNGAIFGDNSLVKQKVKLSN